MQFRLLGPLQVLGDRAPLSLGQPKQRLLLACLLLRRGRFTSRENLIEALWGEHPPRSAVGSLHVYVHGLRRLLGAERIEGRGEAYRIHLEPGEFDLEHFEDLVREARASLEAGQTARAVRGLQAALGLWRGPALGDLPSDTLVAERAQLEELRLSAIELLLESRLGEGEHERVVAELSTLIAEHPYRERLREHQILALYRAGRQKEALEAYRAAREILLEELGIEPGPRLRNLEGAVLRQDPELATRRPRGAAPPAEATDRPHVALPAPPTRLIGRWRELGEVERLFGEHGARLVTLTGPGGAGKTRLALAVAERLAPRLPDGARFIDLSATPDPDLVLPVIADELDVPAGQAALHAIAQLLAPRRMLLVLDNFERLLPAAGAVADLLSAAPGLTVLVTSRARLHLRAEHEYDVPPLPLPDAVQLLAERTRAVNRSVDVSGASAPAFERICRRLDGLPLALELVAGRMRTLSPESVAAGLDHALELLVDGPRDLPARQQTLRATLEWSHEQLSEVEQHVFAELGAFAGSYYRDDVAAVCGPEADHQLGALIEASLVSQTAPGRLTMLETIREYALERLVKTGDAEALRTRHCGHFLVLAERAHDAILRGEEPASAYRSLERAHDNLLEALSWAEQSGVVELEVRLACALRQFWLVRGHLAEGRTFFERAVAATERADPQLRAQALMHGGPFLYRTGELVQARNWWEEALALLTGQGDVAGASRCAGELGAVAFSEGDLDHAAELFARAADGFASLGDRMRLAIVRSNQAEVAAIRGELARAIEHSQEAVTLAREVGDADSLALALHTLARLLQKTGDGAAARAVLAECLVQARELGYREVLANCLQATAEQTLADRGDPELAARFQVVARRALEEIGAPLQGLEAESFARTEEQLERLLGAERMEAVAAEQDDSELESVLDDAAAVLEGRDARASVSSPRPPDAQRAAR